MAATAGVAIWAQWVFITNPRLALPTVNLAKGKDQRKPKAPTSQGQMQRQVERGQAPRSVDRVDPPHVRGDQPHVHFKDGYARNQNGTTRHGSARPLTGAEQKWLIGNGWK
jgi:hypothetical protein